MLPTNKEKENVMKKTINAKVTSRSSVAVLPDYDPPYGSESVEALLTYNLRELKGEIALEDGTFIVTESDGVPLKGVLTKVQIVSRLTGVPVEEVQQAVDSEKGFKAPPKPGSVAGMKERLKTLKKEGKFAGAIPATKAELEKALASAVALKGDEKPSQWAKKPPTCGTKEWCILVLKSFWTVKGLTPWKGLSTKKVEELRQESIRLGLLAKDKSGQWFTGDVYNELAAKAAKGK